MKHRGCKILVLILLFSVVAQPSDASMKRSQKTTLTVFAAASLSKVFATLAKQFEIKHPDVIVQFSFLASSTLATQILAGAPADVFASAAVSDMNSARSLIPESSIFTSNRVVLATPVGNKFHIKRIADLNKRGVKWIQCAHVVPCGAAADAALAFEGGITSKPVSFEPNASSVVAKAVSGEVDSAIIYHSDFVANNLVLKEIRFRGRQASTTLYPIGVLLTSHHQDMARSFVALVLSAYGRAVLGENGFTTVN